MNGGGRVSQLIHVNQVKLKFPPNNRLELPKYQATITHPQRSRQVLSDNYVTDMFFSAEDENNPRHQLQRTELLSHQIREIVTVRTQIIELLYILWGRGGGGGGGDVLSPMFGYSAILDFCC